MPMYGRYSPWVPVLGRVVFTDAALFPHGVPEGVSQLSGLRNDCAALQRGTVPAPLAHAWDVLMAQARTDAAARKAHLRDLRARHGPDRRLWRGALLLGCALLPGIGSVWFGHRASLPSVFNSIRLPYNIPTPALPARAEPSNVPNPRSRPVGQPPTAPRVSSVPSLTWANPTGEATQSEACKRAIATVLISRSPEDRYQRDRLCGSAVAREKPHGPTPDSRP